MEPPIHPPPHPPTSPAHQAAPVASPGPQPGSPLDPGRRLVTLDAIRGLAVLGILLVNMPFFAMPSAYGEQPHVYLDLAPLDAAAWVAVSVFAEGKFITLFSFLFGAGVWLSSARADATGRPAAAIHYRRMAWLLLFGIVHAYLIWSGDILVSYALMGMLLFPLRNVAVRVQLLISAAGFLVGAGVLLCLGGLFWAWAEADPLSFAEFDLYAPEHIEAEVAAYTGGVLDQLVFRVPVTLGMQIGSLMFYGPWYVGVMLLGMAAARTGIVSGERRPPLYLVVLAAGLALLVVPLAIAVLRLEHRDESPTIYMLTMLLDYLVAPVVGLAYAAAMVLIVKAGVLRLLVDAFAAAGRMALTNYLAQSLICTLIFYGHGFGLFGAMGHAQLLLLTLVIWGLQLVLSPFWLAHFRFGPMEWLWRSLTYWQLQPMCR